MTKNQKRTVNKIKKTVKENKKPIIIAAIGTGVAMVAIGLGKAFKSMKASAKAQHEVDKAEFAAAKAEAKANFEENRGRNTFKRAKASAKKTWDDAHMSISERDCGTSRAQSQNCRGKREKGCRRSSH